MEIRKHRRWYQPRCVSFNVAYCFESYNSCVERSVLVGIGVEVNFEVIAAAALLRTHAPALRVRVVNVTDLMILSANGTHPHSLTHEAFNSLFTEDKPIHFNFHGYPIELQGLLYGRPIQGRATISGSVTYLLYLTMNADSLLQIHGRRHHYLVV